MDRARRLDERCALGHVLESLPPKAKVLAEQLEFVIDTSPNFIGLHNYGPTRDGRHYSQTSHACWPHHINRPADDRRPTVILAGKDVFNPLIVLHEIGHGIDALLGTPSYWIDMIPLTGYAKKDCFEAFAVAFQSWLSVDNNGWNHGYSTIDALKEYDPRTLTFFETVLL